MASQPVDARCPSGSPPDSFFLCLVRFWIWLTALASLAGWTLSALGQLNRTGYAVFIITAAGLSLGFGWRPRCTWPSLGKFRGRFRRPLPGLFALLTLAVLIGSLLYPPSNYTGLNYHLGRVLQWIGHGQWWWIHTPVIRMNYAGCAFEWLTTPVVLFTGTDRFLFLVNFIPFLLLPGLVFSLFTRLGVRRRTAWHWMWLLPTGYNFLLQGGSIGNDAFGAIYALAAVDFGCRAWESRRVQDLWCSLLAAAVLTGIKPVSLPLLLPWAIVTFPLLLKFRRQWLATMPVAGLALVASFAPQALMNWTHTGDWLARNIEPFQKSIHQPLVGIIGNLFQILQDNVVPPIFPLAGWWNVHAPSLLPHSLAAAFDANFESGFYIVGEVPTEDLTGLGFGVCGLMMISVTASLWLRCPAKPFQNSAAGALPRWLAQSVLVASWLAFIAYAMKSGITTGARLIAPYYLLLIPLLLTGAGQARLTRLGWWRQLACFVPALAFLVLIVSPDRPLWPAKTILREVLARHPGQKTATRALDVYTLYAKRNDALAAVRELLPAGVKELGFIGDGDDCDVSLWRPFGSRRVDHFLLTDPPEMIRTNVQYVVVGGWNLSVDNQRIDDWLQRNHAELIATTNLTVKLGEGPQNWYLTRLKP